MFGSGAHSAPRESRRRPGGVRRHVLVLPGGGYGRLAPHEGEPVVEWLQGLGVEASVFRYPVLTRHPLPTEAIRAEIRRWRAEGVDEVGVLGFSAGGHAAGMAALAPADDPGDVADLAVLCYPVVSMVLPGHEGSRLNLLGPDADEHLRRATSLELLVTPDAPPVFLWHTSDDDVVPVAPVYRLGEALHAAGVAHAVHVYPSGKHGLGLAIGSGLPEMWTAECAAWLADRGWLG
ncbi:alpha/beta hydrolase [Herbiconiux daphne]|uniref:Prolyl oligopeptidase family serine peptidase n=1 Tax=Herbiconiux daphne TaxID=2970914 RepID=A0ABT2H6F1_9MICO|nr:prolyl oligopeptidase family serine peptidase [Herbiconiux daphne]MCS5735504.1 prolyl oligopeptidase family serine peptidase [Herbiconiux daphne]